MKYQTTIELLAKPYLLQGTFADVGVALVLKIVEFRADPETEQKEKRKAENPDDWTTSLSPSPRFSAWEYQKVLNEGIIPLAKREPFTVARILIDAVASMIRLRMHREQREKVSDEDASEIWCRRLDQRGLSMEGSDEALVNALTTACGIVYESAPKSIDALDQILRNQRWNLFRRLRQHLYALHPTDQTLPWIREAILAHKDYAQWDHQHEFQKMIRTASEHFGNRLLTESERSSIFDAILSGPSKVGFREWMGDNFSDDAWNSRKRYFHRKQLHPFSKILLGEYRTYYDELEEELADKPLDDEEYSLVGESRGGTVSYRSPRSYDDLVQFGDETLLAFINEWEEAHQDANDWLIEINISALAGTFQTVFKNVIIPNATRLSFWMTNRQRIERPIYVKAMVAAMRELTKEKQFEQLEQWLAFGDWVLERPNEAFESDDQRSSDEFRQQANWRSSRREVGDFVGVCLEKDVQVPLFARDALAALLRKLCTHFDYRLDRDRPVLLNRDDQVTEAINNTRSRALESLLNFGYWLRRHEVTGDIPELQEILGKRLADNSAIPLTMPEHAILGLHFGRIWELNNEWAVSNKNRLFPQGNSTVWIETFNAFIRYSHPYLPIFEILREDFALALERLEVFNNVNGMGRNSIDALGQHLFTYFLWEVYPLQGEDSLLSAFYDKTNSHREYWAHLFDHVGRTLRNAPPKLNEKLHGRVLAFFEWRLQQAEPIELKEFTFWLEAPCLDARWRLDAFLKVLGLTRNEGAELSIELDTLNELLESHPSEVVECLARITEAITSNRYVYLPFEKVKPILLVGLSSREGNIRTNAERARENLLKAGRFEFLDLK